MSVKVIIDLSNATEEEIEQFHNYGRVTEMLKMVNNARKYAFEFVQLADKVTAANYYANQTENESGAGILQNGRSSDCKVDNAPVAWNNYDK